MTADSYVRFFMRNALIPIDTQPDVCIEAINRMERLMVAEAWDQGFWFKETYLFVIDRGVDGTEYAVYGLGFPRTRILLLVDAVEYDDGAW